MDGLVEGPVVAVGVGVDDDGDVGVGLAVFVEEVLIFGVDDDAVGVAVVKDVGDVVGFEAVVDCDVDTACGADAEDAVEEGRGVGAEDAYALVAFLADVVCETFRAVCKFGIRALEDGIVGGAMVDGGGIGLDLGRAG